MGSCTGAAIGVVSKLMDVHTPLSGGVITLEIVGDCGWRRFIGLLEGEGPSDGRVSADNCD